MQQEDDLRGLAKTMEFMRAISILFVVIHVYWYCYEAFSQMGFTLEIVDKVLVNFHRTAGLFGSLLTTKVFAVIFLALSCLGTQGIKNDKITWEKIHATLLAGLVLFFMNWWMLRLPLSPVVNMGLYVIAITAGYILMLMAGQWTSRMLKNNLMTDVFNTENESFMQETRLLQNEYSVNLPTKFVYKGKEWQGWVNVVNPFRASIVLGTPGSGKSFAVVNSFIKQQISKGFAVYIYDYKFDDLSLIAYNCLLKNLDNYKVKPRFYVINFDDPRRSHRCNPIAPEFMTDISDAYESAYTIMLNLNKTWIQKQGDFFVESPIILLAAIIWYLKIYKDGKYCTFPHAIELLNRNYEDLFPILTSYPELENYLSPFMDAWQGGAQDQLQGQIASAKIPLSRMISPQLYWVMTGNDFSLDINNPESPKVLCVGNNPDRQNIYSAALGLYNSRIVRLINKKGRLKSAVIIDELPTIYFRGLDNLIATARSNKVAVCLGFQDFSQLNRDYGDKESKVIQNTVGNIFSGQVVGETAKTLSERFGKILQQRQSLSINRQDTSTSINTQLDSLIPASKIANLSQGTFVGAVSDNFGEEIEQKIFHARIVVDTAAIAAETKNYRKIPIVNPFLDDKGNDIMSQQIQWNYDKVKRDVIDIVAEELERIKSDSNLSHLLKQETTADSKEE
ncbi:conjugal transfer protein MobC [Alistipes finegoldii]|uniref:conjugal transfer protein MobC n=1 Tax=Alistipes finegoldii TaxID=214856 RepID=UPI00189A5BAC|nr:conjugal transfer protein MobC [Alistipes finegoldii]